MNKTAFVIPYKFLPPHNGGHRAALGFGRALARQTTLVWVSTPDNLTEGTDIAIEHCLPPGPVRYVSGLSAWRCFRLFSKEKITYCILFQPFIGIVLFPVLWLLRIRSLVYVQNMEYQRFRSMGKKWWPLVYAIEWWVYRNAWRLLFISPADAGLAVGAFNVSHRKCRVVPYGVPFETMPTDREAVRKMILSRLHLDQTTKTILFFGPQNYQPNREAVDRIMDTIAPRLRQLADFPYRILICGGGMPQERLQALDEKILYLGFVEDIDPYVKAADVVINPVNTGGGVKTKIIEAIAMGTPVISTATGAVGVDRAACGDKLVLVSDDNFGAFADAIVELAGQPTADTPAAFYQTYYWNNAIQPVVELLR